MSIFQRFYGELIIGLVMMAQLPCLNFQLVMYCPSTFQLVNTVTVFPDHLQVHHFVFKTNLSQGSIKPVFPSVSNVLFSATQQDGFIFHKEKT